MWHLWLLKPQPGHQRCRGHSEIGAEAWPLHGLRPGPMGRQGLLDPVKTKTKNQTKNKKSKWKIRYQELRQKVSEESGKTKSTVDPPQLSPDKCDYTSKSEYDINIHTRKKHRLCSGKNMFATLNLFEKQADFKGYPCSICKKIIPTIDKLNAHKFSLKEFHSECPHGARYTCKYPALNCSDLQEHMWNHGPEEGAWACSLHI